MIGNGKQQLMPHASTCKSAAGRWRQLRAAAASYPISRRLAYTVIIHHGSGSSVS